jgi:predicted DCC family thiol-disulfide oxidoreductase YuxK
VEGRPSEPEKARKAQAVTVFYDDTCPLCRRAAETWRRRDREGRLRLRPFDEPEAEALTGRPRARLAKSIHVLVEGRVADGVEALAAVYRALPGGRPIATLLHLSARLGIGDPAYRVLAGHRHSLSQLLRQDSPRGKAKGRGDRGAPSARAENPRRGRGEP